LGDPREFALKPIGTVRSPWRTRGEIPVQGGPSAIEVLLEYEPALDGVERATHLVVLAFLHEADRDVLSSRPRKLDPEAPPCGVFASRSPSRPNPLALSVVRLLRRDGSTLQVDPLDLLDGTPVVDLKSYNPGWDGAFCARPARRVRQSALDDATLRAFLQRDLDNHLGDAAREAPARLALEAVMAAVRAFDADGRDPRLSVAIGKVGAVADALIGLTGATFGSGRIALDPSLGPEHVLLRLGERELRFRS
jgi:tRNA-Thr(GGU) m(6)t(6)A37 methyltransferase TsaA